MILDTETVNRWRRMLRDQQTLIAALENMFYVLNEVDPDDPIRDEFYKLIAQHANAPFGALESVIYHSCSDLAAVVAANEDAPAIMLENLMGYQDWQVRRNLALNPATPRRILALLAEAYDQEVSNNPSLAAELAAKVESASRDDLKIEEVVKLSQAPFPDIRIAIAENTKTPIPILAQLAEDKSWRVRLAIARNRNTPAVSLAKLADDQDPADDYYSIPQAIAGNPSTPIAILEKLARYKWDFVPPDQWADLQDIEAVRIAATKNLQSKTST